MTDIVRYELRRFGSRRYGVALPSSDLDIVVQLPMDIDRLRVDQKQILERVLERLRFDARQTTAAAIYNFSGTNAIYDSGLLEVSQLRIHKRPRGVALA